jgi:hypothetical protein
MDKSIAFLWSARVPKTTISLSLDIDLLAFWDTQLAREGGRRSTWLNQLLSTWRRTGVKPLQFRHFEPAIGAADAPSTGNEYADEGTGSIGPDGLLVPDVPVVPQPQYLHRRWKPDIGAWVVTYRIGKTLQFAAVFDRETEMWVYRVEKRAATTMRDGTPTRLYGAYEGQPFQEYSRIGQLTNA